MRYALITNQDLFRMTGQGSTSNGEIPPLELCGLGILEGNAAPQSSSKFKLTSEPPHQVNRDPFQAWSAWGLQVSVWRKVYQHGRGRGAFWRAGHGIGWGKLHGSLDFVWESTMLEVYYDLLEQNILETWWSFDFKTKSFLEGNENSGKSRGPLSHYFRQRRPWRDLADLSLKWMEIPEGEETHPKSLHIGIDNLATDVCSVYYLFYL